ncbi:MAG: AMP-binding protein [Chloroflexi bacterium]|nr:AMP-binding protein [Chloroflexota bacterium]
MIVSDMLAQNARLYPEETALIELRPSKNFHNAITWREFDARANQAANALIEMGVRKGDKVMHWMTNSVEWLEAYFGILRTGAWAVPLNFRFTSQDLKYCADIAEARTLVLGEEFTERVSSIRNELPIDRYIFVGEVPPKGMLSFGSIVEASSSEPPRVKFGPDDECALYFTSGTTGAPKPILLTQKNLECAAITENRNHRQTHDDNFILIPPLYHTGAKMHWFGNLIVGGKGTILAEFSPKNLLEAVHREKGTIAFLLVPWAQDVLTALEQGDLRLEDYDLGCWRLMHIGAQPVPPSLVRSWKQWFPSMQYDTNFGLSESAGPGCVHLGIENEHKVGAIGKPGYNWQARIVDDSGRDVPRGQVGELVVKGDGVMKEYYKNPGLTAKTIRDGWLFTGDMGRIDEDDFIWLVDRKKDVIITGGENIYPVEVENILRSHPRVNDAAVIGRPDKRLGEIVLAVIDPKPGVTLIEDEINAFCELHLPRYKRPRCVVFDKVPRNPTGKIEKPKLRQKYGGSLFESP